MAIVNEKHQAGMGVGVSQIVPGAHTSPIVTRGLMEKVYIQVCTYFISYSHLVLHEVYFNMLC